MALPPLLIDTPEVAPRRFGLFSVAKLFDFNDGHWQGGVEYEALNCAGGDLDAITDACDPIAKNTAPNQPFATYPPITGYYLHECRAVGGWAEASTRAMRGYAAREQAFLEKVVVDQVVGASALSNGCPEVALAEAQGYLDSTYVGDGVIHIGSAVASMLGSRLQRQGNHIETRLGTPVSIGAYGNRVIATGAVTIRRGVATTTPAPLAEVTPAMNTIRALVERTYVIDTDCAAALSGVITISC
ncbi:MAG: hypothetical protein KC435_14820 [Thermomicrobiales bacterium]|nr:hypothetical protein [Thermomicrobiales bacterium]